MKFAQIALVAGALGLTLACDGGPGVGTDTFDTGTGPTPVPGAPLIQIINPNGCNGGGSAFEFGIETENQAGLAILTIWDTTFNPSFDEEHLMSLTATDPDGAWDQWDVSLTEGVSLGNQVPGQSTVFQCANENALTFAIEVSSDQAGTNVTDCAVFGDDPAQLINGTWPTEGANTNGTVIGNRFANCLNWN